MLKGKVVVPILEHYEVNVLLTPKIYLLPRSALRAPNQQAYSVQPRLWRRAASSIAPPTISSASAEGWLRKVGSGTEPTPRPSDDHDSHTPIRLGGLDSFNEVVAEADRH